MPHCVIDCVSHGVTVPRVSLTWIVMGSDHGASCVIDWGSHGVTVPCVSFTGIVMGSLCLMCR